jgi:hypothetical protein
MVRDPETGELRAPTEEEFLELHQPAVDRRIRSGNGDTPAEASGRKTQPSRAPEPVEIEHPDGAVSITLDESTTSFAVARRTADGKVVTTETTGAKAAVAAVAQGAAKPGVKHAK